MIDTLIVPAGDSIGHLNPIIVSMELGDTTETSLHVSVLMNFTNPTNYSATIPFFDVKFLFNNTAVGHVIARNVSVVPGNNGNVSLQMSWDPWTNGGHAGVEAGRKFVSSYISGMPYLTFLEDLPQASWLTPSRRKHNCDDKVA